MGLQIVALATALVLVCARDSHLPVASSVPDAMARFPEMREIIVIPGTSYSYALVALRSLQASVMTTPFGVIEEYTGLIPALDFAPPAGTYPGRSVVAAFLAHIEKRGGTWQDAAGVLVLQMQGAPSPCRNDRSVEALEIEEGTSTRDAIHQIATAFPSLQVEWNENAQWPLRNLSTSVTIPMYSTLVEALADLVRGSPVSLHSYRTLQLTSGPGDKRPFWLLWYEGRRCTILVH